MDDLEFLPKMDARWGCVVQKGEVESARQSFSLSLSGLPATHDQLARPIRELSGPSASHVLHLLSRIALRPNGCDVLCAAINDVCEAVQRSQQSLESALSRLYGLPVDMRDIVMSELDDPERAHVLRPAWAALQELERARPQAADAERVREEFGFPPRGKHGADTLRNELVVTLKEAGVRRDSIALLLWLASVDGPQGNLPDVAEFQRRARDQIGPILRRSR